VLFALGFLLQNHVARAIDFLIYLPATLLLATVFCLLVEEPFMRLGRKLGRTAKIEAARVEGASNIGELEPESVAA
jgi:peptidoglycan/LPS O-acetylase OafA/YrhL